MKTPITPLKMPLDLKARAKEQADKEGLSLSKWIYKAIENKLQQATADSETPVDMQDMAKQILGQ